MKLRRLRAAVVVVLAATAVTLTHAPVVHAVVPSPFDSTFGTNGIARATIPLQLSDVAAQNILTDSAGRHYSDIQINVRVGESRFSIVRYNSNGTLDATYGTNGRTKSIPLGTPTIAMQSDNKVVVAGFTWTNNASYLRVYRFTTSGILDTTFGEDGMFSLQSFPASRFETSSLTIAVHQSSNRIIVGTNIYIPNMGNNSFFITAITSDGTTDYEWNNGGGTTVTPRASGARGYSQIFAIRVLTDGSTIALGSTWDSNGKLAVVLVKLQPSGYLDQSFDGASGNSNGMIITPFANEDESAMTALAVLNDGSIAIAGHANAANGTAYYGMAKFDAGGIPVNTFGSNGFVLTNTPRAGNYWIYSLAQESNGNFVFPITSGTSPGFMRIQANGTINTSSQCAVCTYGGINASAASLTTQSTGNVLVTVYSETGDQRRLIRLTASGAYDPTFQLGLGQINELSWSSDTKKIIPQPDGTILVIARTSVGYNYGQSLSRPAVFKFLSNGTLDTTFGTNGYVSLAPPSHAIQWFIQDAQVQNDGKVLLLSTERNDDYQIRPKISLSRINANGSLDSSFGVSGTTTTSDNAALLDARSLTIASNGAIYVSSYRYDYNTDSAQIFKYLNDGSLDTSFSDSNNIPGVVRPISNAYYLDTFPANGKLMLAGGTYINSVDHAFVARMNLDGTLDTSFNSTGIRLWETRTTNSLDAISTVHVATNGLITIGGWASNPTDVDVVMQLQPNGSTNSQFNSTGRREYTVYDTSTMTWAGQSTMTATDSDFILVGTMYHRNARQTAQGFVSKIRANGQMNSDFGSNGVVSLPKDMDIYFETVTQIQESQFLIGGGVRENNATQVLLMKLGGAPATPTTSPTTTTPLTTVAPSTTTVPPATSASSDDIKLVITVSQSSILKRLKLTVPAGAKVAMTSKTKKVCRVVKTKVIAASTGTCKVTVTITDKKKKKTSKTLSLRVT